MDATKDAKPRFKKWYVRGAKYPYKLATIDSNGNPENVWDFRTEFERSRFVSEKFEEYETHTFIKNHG